MEKGKKMEKLQAFDENTEASGSFLLAFIKNLKSEEIFPILRKHNLVSVDPDAWYPHQLALDVLHDVAYGTEGGMMNLVAIGMGVVDTAMSEQINQPGITLEEGLISLNDTYQLNHRNGYAGEISVVVMGPRHVELVDHTPYTDDTMFGMIYALARKLSPVGSHPIVRHLDDAPCRKEGDDSCTYEITW